MFARGGFLPADAVDQILRPRASIVIKKRQTLIPFEYTITIDKKIHPLGKLSRRLIVPCKRDKAIGRFRCVERACVYIRAI
jgi:hypothetical protein